MFAHVNIRHEVGRSGRVPPLAGGIPPGGGRGGREREGEGGKRGRGRVGGGGRRVEGGGGG